MGEVEYLEYLGVSYILLYAELVEYEVGEKVKEVEYLGVYSTVGGVS